MIDEAHNIERVAEDHFGVDISNHRARFLLDGLYNPRTHRGLLAHAGDDEAIGLVRETDRAANAFFKRVQAWYDAEQDAGNGRCRPHFIDDTVSPALTELKKRLGMLSEEGEDEDQKFELARVGGPLPRPDPGLGRFPVPGADGPHLLGRGGRQPEPDDPPAGRPAERRTRCPALPLREVQVRDPHQRHLEHGRE